MEDRLDDLVRAFGSLAIDDPVVGAHVLVMLEGDGAAATTTLLGGESFGDGAEPGPGAVTGGGSGPGPVEPPVVPGPGRLGRARAAVVRTVQVHPWASGLVALVLVAVTALVRWRGDALGEVVAAAAAVIGLVALFVVILSIYALVVVAWMAWLTTDARRTSAWRVGRPPRREDEDGEPDVGPLSPGGRTGLPVPLPRSVPAFAPLIPDHRARSVLGSAVGRRIADGPIDVEALVRRVADGLPVEEIPRRKRLSTAVGVQILVDRGPAMAPFERDVDDVVSRVVRLVPDDAGSVVEFEGSPLHRVLAVTGDGDVQHRSYARSSLPVPGATVLVLCDLGIGRPTAGPRSAPVDEWLALLDELAPRDCRVLFLVPYGPHRWPAELAEAGATVLWWDRRGTERWVRAR